MKDKPTFELQITPRGNCDRAEAFRRLKAALKALGRSYGWRCVRIVEVEPSVTTKGIED